MTVQQFDGSAVQVFQEKTGNYVWTPAHKSLRDRLTQAGITGTHLLTKRSGKGMTGDYLYEIVADAVKDLGFSGYTPHGLRNAAGAALAEAGCTVDES